MDVVENKKWYVIYFVMDNVAYSWYSQQYTACIYVCSVQLQYTACIYVCIVYSYQYTACIYVCSVQLQYTACIYVCSVQLQYTG